MDKSIKFIKPNDLSIIESEDEFVLRKGFLHINEVVIDKTTSSKNFNKKMQEFMENKELITTALEEECEDFTKLSKFGIIDIAMNKKFLLIVNDNYKEITGSLCADSVDIRTTKDFFFREDVKILVEDKNTYHIRQIKERYLKALSEYNHVYFVEQFSNLSINRAFNRLMNQLDMEYTMGIFDNENVYVTGVKPKYTGCYECLERHIISKFQGTIKYYEKKYDHSLKSQADKADLTLLLGMILKDMNNINKYDASSLTGNVIQFYTPNFEYSFNINRKSTSCPVCAKMNHIHFEEQNIRSVNAIKEVFLS